jgi:hypothetical protein
VLYLHLEYPYQISSWFYIQLLSLAVIFSYISHRVKKLFTRVLSFVTELDKHKKNVKISD